MAHSTTPAAIEKRWNSVMKFNKTTNLWEPKYLALYDNGGPDHFRKVQGELQEGSIDRYVAIYRRVGMSDGRCYYVGMSDYPFHPQGFCQHGEHTQAIDYPSYGHLGKKIGFSALNQDCRKAILRDYADYWTLPLERLLEACLEK